jgi:predicted transcriptional regulator
MRNYIDVSKILELREKNYTNIQIAKALKYGEHTISKYLKLNGTKPFNKRSFIKMTNYQKEVLVGTLLGDACIKYGAKTICPKISIGHTIKQKEYLLRKAEVFESLKSKVAIYKYVNAFTKEMAEVIYYSSVYFDELNAGYAAF